MKTRGRRILLCAKLQKQICGYLSDCTTVKTACEASGISLSSFFLWIEKGEKGQSPYKEFSDAVTRARGKAKVKIVRSLLDEKDWRPRLELLARVFPDEYGRREIVPQVEQERPPTLLKVVLNTNGKTLEEITNFPIIESLPPNEAKPPHADNKDAPQRVPQVIAGHCVGWRDRDELDDADPEELP
jgi:hypothetical protein